MIRAVAFAAIVAGATWLSHIYDQFIKRNDRSIKREEHRQ